MQETTVGQKIYTAIKRGAERSKKQFEERELNTQIMLWIFWDLSSDQSLIDDLKKMRDVESKVRNVAAHEIVSVTNDWIKNRTEMTGEDIMKLLKRLVARAGIRAKAEYWNSYNDMNFAISAELLQK